MPVEAEGITLADLDGGEPLLQARDQVAVFFDGDHPPRPLDQGSGEPARPGSYLQHGVVRAGLERIRDPRQESGIGEKMLSQPALGPGHP